MAHRLLRPAGRAKSALFSPLSSYHPKTLIHKQPNTSLRQPTIPNPNFLSQQSRGYISEMRKSAFEDNILRLIRNDIQYELDRSPPTKLVPQFNSFAVEERPGEQWIKLNKKFGDNEEIKVEATMFDASQPLKKDAGIATVDDVEVYIGMVVNIVKEKGSDVLEFDCYVWPNSVEIARISLCGQDKKADQHYTGPPFDDLDDELQKSLYDFLETRGINDELSVFLHRCMQKKRKNEFVRWMGNVKSFVEKKS